MQTPKISLIAAMAANRAIGLGKGLPWPRLPVDVRWFIDKTMGHVVVMGRKTFETIGPPLPGRSVIVVTRSRDYSPQGVTVVQSVDEALARAAEAGETEVFVAGGGEIFRLVLDRADRIYLTRIHAEFPGDTFFPDFDESEWTVVFREDHPATAENPYPLTFLVMDRATRPTGGPA